MVHTCLAVWPKSDGSSSVCNHHMIRIVYFSSFIVERNLFPIWRRSKGEMKQALRQARNKKHNK